MIKSGSRKNVENAGLTKYEVLMEIHKYIILKLFLLKYKNVKYKKKISSLYYKLLY